jgi:hypothetical protein
MQAISSTAVVSVCSAYATIWLLRCSVASWLVGWRCAGCGTSGAATCVCTADCGSGVALLLQAVQQCALLLLCRYRSSMSLRWRVARPLAALRCCGRPDRWSCGWCCGWLVGILPRMHAWKRRSPAHAHQSPSARPQSGAALASLTCTTDPPALASSQASCIAKCAHTRLALFADAGRGEQRAQHDASRLSLPQQQQRVARRLVRFVTEAPGCNLIKRRQRSSSCGSGADEDMLPCCGPQLSVAKPMV